MENFSSSELLHILLGGVKAFIACMFALNVGVILTWAERRWRGMIQDCIGPNRASLPLPGKAAAFFLAAGPGASAAAAVAAVAWLIHSQDGSKALWGTIFLQAGIFLMWLTLAAIGRAVRRDGPSNFVEKEILGLGSPRGIVLTGLASQLLFLALGLFMSSRELYAEDYENGSFWGGAALLAFMMLVSSGHVAAQYWKQKTVRFAFLGLLHPLADGLKTAFKADFVPPGGDRLLYNLAPWITLLAALVLLAVVPFGPTMCFESGPGGAADFMAFTGIEAAGQRCQDARFSLMAVDLQVGILYFFAMAGTGVVGAALAGWSSNNKFSLLGGMRAASQMVSYEVTLGLTVIGALMIYGTLQLDQMVLWQAENAWGIFVQPFAFVLFLTAAIAEAKRVPFDLPEGESELVAGYFTEYSGMKFAMFYFAEYIAVATSSTLMAVLFFGGWHVPFVSARGIDIVLGGQSYLALEIPGQLLVLIGVLAFVFKVLALCLLQVTIRWTLPRFRYDQLMRLSWRKLLPASLANVLVTALVLLAVESSSTMVQRAIAFLGQTSMLILAFAAALSLLSLLLFLLIPSRRKRLVVSSAARFTEMMGGTRSAKMEA